MRTVYTPMVEEDVLETVRKNKGHVVMQTLIYITMWYMYNQMYMYDAWAYYTYMYMLNSPALLFMLHFSI